MNVIFAIHGLLFWLSLGLASATLLWALRTASWRRLFARNERQHLWYGAIALLSVGWSMLGVSIEQSVRLHPMILTSLTLVFGFRLAIIAAFIALLPGQWILGFSWASFPLSWLISSVVPAALTFTLWRIVTLTRIQNLFLYTLGVGFVGGLLTSVAIGATTLATFWLFEPERFSQLQPHAYLFFLFSFPEGFINGTIVSSMAIMAPWLMKTYDDDFYLK